MDGRIKPEIMGSGYNINSTIPFNAYGGSTGSSMSCPAVTGSLALLYERYRQLHAGANPSAALIKAVACNSADDLGNPGPDYFYGFGMLNARKAVDASKHASDKPALEEIQPFRSKIAEYGQKTGTHAEGYLVVLPYKEFDQVTGKPSAHAILEVGKMISSYE